MFDIQCVMPICMRPIQNCFCTTFQYTDMQWYQIWYAIVIQTHQPLPKCLFLSVDMHIRKDYAYFGSRRCIKKEITFHIWWKVVQKQIWRGLIQMTITQCISNIFLRSLEEWWPGMSQPNPKRDGILSSANFEQINFLWLFPFVLGHPVVPRFWTLYNLLQ